LKIRDSADSLFRDDSALQVQKTRRLATAPRLLALDHVGVRLVHHVRRDRHDRLAADVAARVLGRITQVLAAVGAAIVAQVDRRGVDRHRVPLGVCHGTIL